MKQSDLPYSHPVAVATLHGETRLRLSPNAEERQRIAGSLGLDAISVLKADLTISHATNGLISVHGTISASIRPICVVTLEPFDDEVNEAVAITFAPAGLIEKMTKRAEENENNDFEPPDEICDGMIDFGALTVEFLTLALDPYPRKPGAEFASATPEPERESPFAKLRDIQLKGADE